MNVSAEKANFDIRLKFGLVFVTQTNLSHHKEYMIQHNRLNLSSMHTFSFSLIYFTIQQQFQPTIYQPPIFLQGSFKYLEVYRKVEIWSAVQLHLLSKIIESSRAVSSGCCGRIALRKFVILFWQHKFNSAFLQINWWSTHQQKSSVPTGCQLFDNPENLTFSSQTTAECSHCFLFLDQWDLYWEGKTLLDWLPP